MSFKLINLATSELIERAVYDDGKKAAKVAARLTAKTGRRYQVRKAADGDANWREREQKRFDTGEYIPLIPALAAVCPPDFFAHIAKKSPDLIAYTKDDEKGRHDKQSLLSVNAFIDVCLDHPVMRDTHERIGKSQGYASMQEYREYNFTSTWRSNTIKFQREHAVALSTPIQFAGPLSADASADQINALMDQIEEVYTHYDGRIHALDVSCMRMEASRYQGRVGGDRVHPTRAYASPDVAIAYMLGADGKTIARALCWPDRKIYSRVYAEGDAFHIAMRQLGYRKAGYYGDESPEKSFAGARLSRIPTDDNGFVVPYIDGGKRRLDDTGSWLTMYGQNIDAETTSGVAWARGVRRTGFCENCEDDDCDESDMIEVYTTSSRSRSVMWCQSCADNHAFYCNGYEVYFDSDNVDSTDVCDETYSTRYVENHASYCDYYEEYTFSDTHEVHVPHGIQRWSESAVSDNAFEYDGVYYSNDVDSVEVVTERYIKQTNQRWTYNRGTRLRLDNVWYIDRIETIPQELIDDGDVEVYEGVDGRTYLVDYRDHYPVARPRVADANPPIPPCWVQGEYADHSLTVLGDLHMQRIRDRKAAREAEHLARLDAALNAAE